MRALKTMLFVSLSHAVITVGLILYGYQTAMVRFDHPEAPVTQLEQVAGSALQVLVQPMYYLWSTWGAQSPDSVEWLFFCLNSALWGGGVGYAGVLLHRRG